MLVLITRDLSHCQVFSFWTLHQSYTVYDVTVHNSFIILLWPVTLHLANPCRLTPRQPPCSEPVLLLILACYSLRCMCNSDSGIIPCHGSARGNSNQVLRIQTANRITYKSTPETHSRIHPDADLLVETSRSVFIICIEEHFQSVILDVGIANYFLRDGFVVTELFLHLKPRNQKHSVRFFSV